MARWNGVHYAVRDPSGVYPDTVVMADAQTVVAGATVGVQYVGPAGDDIKQQQWRIWVDIHGGPSYRTDNGLYVPEFGTGYQPVKVLGLLLSFLDAFAEARAYGDGNNENAYLFPDELMGWAIEAQMEVQALKTDIDEVWGEGFSRESE